MDSIIFYSKGTVSLPMALLPRGSKPREHPYPEYFTISFGPTKADPLAKYFPLPIAAPSCVKALWDWLHFRRDTLPINYSAPELFSWPSASSGMSFKLKVQGLIDTLMGWSTPLYGESLIIKGRSFRRGGASALLAAGADQAVIMSAGRWKSSSMINVYSSKQSKQSRALAGSRAMDTAALHGN